MPKTHAQPMTLVFLFLICLSPRLMAQSDSNRSCPQNGFKAALPFWLKTDQLPTRLNRPDDTIQALRLAYFKSATSTVGDAEASIPPLPIGLESLLLSFPTLTSRKGTENPGGGFGWMTPQQIDHFMRAMFPHIMRYLAVAPNGLNGIEAPADQQVKALSSLIEAGKKIYSESL